VKADAGLKLSPSTLICPPAGVSNSRVPRAFCVIANVVLVGHVEGIARSKDVWPKPGSAMVCVDNWFPALSRVTTTMFAGCVETLAIAMAVENSLVLSNHTRYALELTLCKGTTACCYVAVTLSVKSAKPPTGPLLSSWADPVASASVRPAVWITSPAPALSEVVNYAVVWLGDPCGNVSGSGAGWPALLKKLRVTFAADTPLFSMVNAVVHWPPP
jgi:hypothetical protein